MGEGGVEQEQKRIYIYPREHGVVFPKSIYIKFLKASQEKKNQTFKKKKENRKLKKNWKKSGDRIIKVGLSAYK